MNAPPSPGFLAFWSVWLRRVVKIKAWEVWLRRDLEPLAGEIVVAVKRQNDATFRHREKDKIPHPATWLNQKRWEDEIEGGGGLRLVPPSSSSPLPLPKFIPRPRDDDEPGGTASGS